MLALYDRYYMLPHLIIAKDAEKALVKRSSKLTSRGGTRTLRCNLLTSFESIFKHISRTKMGKRELAKEDYNS